MTPGALSYPNTHAKLWVKMISDVFIDAYGRFYAMQYEIYLVCVVDRADRERSAAE